jgi:hypothetical protein
MLARRLKDVCTRRGMAEVWSQSMMPHCTLSPVSPSFRHNPSAVLPRAVGLSGRHRGELKRIDDHGAQDLRDPRNCYGSASPRALEKFVVGRRRFVGNKKSRRRQLQFRKIRG